MKFLLFVQSNLSFHFTIFFIPTDMKKILEIEPTNDQARKTVRRLEPLAAAKREKMKEEMIGKSYFF